MRTSIPFNNFVYGQIDRDTKARFDLPLYENGFEIVKNFFHTIKGSAIYRSGFKFIDEISKSAFYKFEFNAEQSYILVFDEKNITFYSYNDNKEFVKVLDNKGEVLTVAHPYGDERFNLHTAQNCDVLYITHTGMKFPEYKLTRKASNKFELTKTAYTNSGTATLSPTDANGYPAVSVFYESRMQRISYKKKPTHIIGSKGGDYDNITTGTESADGYNFDLSESNSQALWAIGAVNSLVIGTNNGIMTVNGGSTTSAITPTNITAKLSCSDKAGKPRPIRKENYIFFISANNRKLFMFEYDIMSEQFKATCINKANYDITNGGMKKIIKKSDRWELIYILCDGKLLAVCFDGAEQVNSWSEIETNGTIIDGEVVTRPDGDEDLCLCIERTINKEKKYYFEMLSDIVEFPKYDDFVNYDSIKNKTVQDDKYAYYRTVAETMKKCNYLDCSIEYSGLQNNHLSFDKDTNTITVENDIFMDSDLNRRIWIKTKTGHEYGIFDIKSIVDSKTVKVIPYKFSVVEADEWYLSATVFKGLEHLENETVSVVGDGGYIGDFVVKNGQVDISSANTNKVSFAIIGLKYIGLLKSCNLGLNLTQQGTQTFTNNKIIYKFEFIFNFSSGGKVGDSLDSLEEIQTFNPTGLYDTPAIPMNEGMEEVMCKGSANKDKHYFIVQDKPLPFHLLAVIPHCRHVPNT